MVEAAAELAGGPRLYLTHQTGERDVELVRAAYRVAGLQADVEPFVVYDMGRRLGPEAWTLIVCRAEGAYRWPSDGRGKGGDSRPAADRDRRSPAEERGSPRLGGCGPVAAAV